MEIKQKNRFNILRFLFSILEGSLIGVGAVLPGISGGVLCVIFGIYKPIMELLSHPFRNFKTHVPKLLPVIIGIGVGFIGIANLLVFFLDKYEKPSICLFVGLIAGMIPSLWREAGEKGRNKASYISLVTAMAIIFAILIGLQFASLTITPNFWWFIFCGFCLALSVIAPGMSFSTLLMPLGLFLPFVSGIKGFDFGVLIPVGIGALTTVVLLAKAVNALFEKYYSAAFHAIIGIVVAATIMIIPFGSFRELWIPNIICLIIGIISALLLDKFNSSIKKDN